MKTDKQIINVKHNYQRVRVRFAPAPTGYLHVGSVRTALFNWLFARANDGDMILRIEDTDIERSAAVYEEDILAGLRWLGLDWDEGPDIGGTHVPYRQSERGDLYTRRAMDLIERGEAYYCFCSEEELAARREAMLAAGKTPRYDNSCRALSRKEVERRLNEGSVPAVRYRVEPSKEQDAEYGILNNEYHECVVKDLIKGEVSFRLDEIGDFIIMKSGLKPAFIFAGVVDDALMGITHVVRGEDHLSNTPRQILLYRALGFGLPQFAHIPLILGPDRSKLSKRHGATSVIQFREEGYLPEAFFNYLSLLGWSPSETDLEILPRQRVVEDFSLERISSSPAVFDTDKLKWMNGQYIKQAPAHCLLKLALPYLHQAGLMAADDSQFTEEWLLEVVELVRTSIDLISRIPDEVSFLFTAMPEMTAEAEEILAVEASRTALNACISAFARHEELQYDIIKSDLDDIVAATGLKKRQLFQPLRAALTGRVHGPELVRIIALLGRDRVLQRLK